jgi:predicted 2-oxoglutarate/Fe(II)-dependent dioxygenase YbiX
MPNRIAGDLVMEGQKTVMKLKEKDILLFTPELEHQVLPVLGGQRDSLVIWFIEKP